MKTLSTLIRFGSCAALGLSLGGCYTSTPQWDAHFGESVRSTLASQVLDPHAGENTDPVSGLGGSAGVRTMNRYDASYSAPRQLPTYRMDIGNATKDE